MSSGGIVDGSRAAHLHVSFSVGDGGDGGDGVGGGGDRELRTTNTEPLHLTDKETKAQEKGFVPGK